MAYQTIFKRYELKYMLSTEQKQKVLEAIKDYMVLDKYGRTTIRNIYFDTDSYQLVRNSIERPIYKEKLRVRSYSRASADTSVFVELKKKYNGIVYKRRVALPEEEAMHWICGEKHCHENTQISEEIDYFLSYYDTLHKTLFLSYEREAYETITPSDFRVTFDDHILCRQEHISLESEVYGTSILPEGKALMEIKCSGGIPFWMVHVLSEEHIYKSSFSKYGTAYTNIIFPIIRRQVI